MDTCRRARRSKAFSGDAQIFFTFFSFRLEQRVQVDNDPRVGLTMARLMFHPMVPHKSYINRMDDIS
jgi:hypothetical protein